VFGGFEYAEAAPGEEGDGGEGLVDFVGDTGGHFGEASDAGEVGQSGLFFEGTALCLFSLGNILSDNDHELLLGVFHQSGGEEHGDMSSGFVSYGAFAGFDGLGGS